MSGTSVVVATLALTEAVMPEQNPRPVVVAVGHDPIDAALAFAAAEAVRAGCGLHLVHAVHILPQGPEMALVAEIDLQRVGRQALNAALERARDLTPSVSVTAELRVGGVVPTIVAMAKDSRMIVLERRELSTILRVVTRSVSSGVAARARVPVVSVPSHWTPRADQGRIPLVTVGVDISERSEKVRRAAAAKAKARGAVLRILHARDFSSLYGGIVLTQTDVEEWADRATAEIQSALDGLGEDVAGLPVQVETRADHAADALIDASRGTDLLVIGRHDPLLPIGSHLGPIARAVLREARCPVLLVDPGPSRG